MGRWCGYPFCCQHGSWLGHDSPRNPGMYYSGVCGIWPHIEPRQGEDRSSLTVPWHWLRAKDRSDLYWQHGSFSKCWQIPCGCALSRTTATWALCMRNQLRSTMKFTLELAKHSSHSDSCVVAFSATDAYRSAQGSHSLIHWRSPLFYMVQATGTFSQPSCLTSWRTHWLDGIVVFLALDSGQTTNVDDNELLASVGVLPLAVRLAKMRLLYAFQWIRHAPQVAVDVVTAEDRDSKSWLGAIRQAIKWFRSMRPQEDEVPPCTIRRIRFRGLLPICHMVRYKFAELPKDSLSNRRWCLTLFKDIVASINGALGKALLKVMFQHLLNFQENVAVTSAHASSTVPKLWMGIVGNGAIRYRKSAATSTTIHVAFVANAGGLPNDFSNIWSTAESFLMVALHNCGSTTNRLTLQLSFASQSRWPVSTVYVAGPHHRPVLSVWRQRQSERREELLQQGQARNYVYELDPGMPTKGKRGTTRGDVQVVGWTWCRRRWRSGLALAWCTTMGWHYNGEWGPYSTFSMGPLFHVRLHSGSVRGRPWQARCDWANLFFEIAECEPLWTWMSTLEAVDGWQPPVLPPERVQAPVPAAAGRDLEPYMDLLAHQEALLAPYTQWPSKMWSTSIDAHLCGWERTVTCPGLTSFFWQEANRRLRGLGREVQCWTRKVVTGPNHRDFSGHRHPSRIRKFGQWCQLHAHYLNRCQGAFLGGDSSGPPCETWSGARHLDLGHRGPRPLRSASLSWGIPHRSLRELVQVGTGSRLMLNSLYLDLIIVDQGGISLMEHPDCPWDPEFASVWRSKIHRQVIMARQLAHELHVQQWRYGSDTVKPTLLRTVGVNGGQAKAALQRNVLADARYPTSTLGGKAATGEFKTAAANEYPTHFCKLLMDLVQSHVASEIRAKRTRTVSHPLLTQAELAWLRSLTEAGSFKTKDRWLPDYQPGV